MPLAIVLCAVLAAADAAPPDHIAIAELPTGPSGRWAATLEPGRRPLQGPAFYALVERPDLRERFETRARLRTAAQIGGPLLALGGVAGAVWFATRPVHAEPRCTGGDTFCINGALAADTAAGIEVMGRILVASLVGGTAVVGGIALATWGARSDPEVVTLDEARALAEDHARRARGEPGLDPALLPARPPPPPPEARLELRLAPGGAALALVF